MADQKANSRTGHQASGAVAGILKCNSQALQITPLVTGEEHGISAAFVMLFDSKTKV